MCQECSGSTHPTQQAPRGGSSRPLASVMLAGVRYYRRALSPLKAGPTCRFTPTCSQYAEEALQRHGAWRGSLLAVRRILKCHPLNPGGFDPVPPQR